MSRQKDSCANKSTATPLLVCEPNAYPALAEVCDLFDCVLITDVGVDDSPVVAVGQKGLSYGEQAAFTATPCFSSLDELNAFCRRNIKQYRSIAFENDGLPAKWFWQN